MWRSILNSAWDSGLTIAWVLSRERVEAGFVRLSPRALSPARLNPGYRSAILFGSGGRRFWDCFRSAHPGDLNVEANPLDHYTESIVEDLAETLRAEDPTAVAAYPFRHARQLLPFGGLTGSLRAFDVAPFGVLIDPEHGPWFAWRGAILTARELPERIPAGSAACASCPAPCVSACPAGAVDLSGFRWRDCVSHRLNAESCRERCLARESCPVGAHSRYGPDETRYYYRASLRMIRNAEHRGGEPA